MAYMSEEGYKQLIEELKYLESVERPKIVSAIAVHLSPFRGAGGWSLRWRMPSSDFESADS